MDKSAEATISSLLCAAEACYCKKKAIKKNATEIKNLLQKLKDNFNYSQTSKWFIKCKNIHRKIKEKNQAMRQCLKVKWVDNSENTI